SASTSLRSPSLLAQAWSRYAPRSLGEPFSMAASKIDLSDERWSVIIPRSTSWQGLEVPQDNAESRCQTCHFFSGKQERLHSWELHSPLPVELTPKPGTGVGPVAIGRPLGDAQTFGRVFQREAECLRI